MFYSIIECLPVPVCMCCNINISHKVQEVGRLCSEQRDSVLHCPLLLLHYNYRFQPFAFQLRNTEQTETAALNKNLWYILGVASSSVRVRPEGIVVAQDIQIVCFQLKQVLFQHQHFVIKLSGVSPKTRSSSHRLSIH